MTRVGGSPQTGAYRATTQAPAERTAEGTPY